VFDFQEFTAVPELFDDAVVPIVLMNHKIPVISLEIVSEYMDLAGIIESQGIQPFEKISNTMFAGETHGVVVVFGFGHDEIGDVLFVGLHGFNIKKHMQGGQVVHIVFLLRGGFKSRSRSSFSPRASLTFLLSFLLFLRLGGSLNETSMGFTVYVLMARRAIQVPALMPLNVF